MLFYQDGTGSSNLKVAASVLTGLNGDGPAREIVEVQDCEIAAAAGRPRSNIKSIVRSPAKPVREDAGSDRKVKGPKR